MAIDITTYELPDEGEDIAVYRDALLSLSGRAMDFSRSMGLISWIQGNILLRARKSKECKRRGDWKAFLASVKMKPGMAYLLRRIATDVTEENKNLEYIQMLRISFPDTYRKNDQEAEDKPFGKQPKSKTTPTPSNVKSQITIDKAHGRLKTVKKWSRKKLMQFFADYEN